MNIKSINDNDVKTGGGGHKHPGNKAYLQLISAYKKQFVIAQNDRAKKDSVVKAVYKKIPGRFVKKNQDGSYTVKSKEFALQKIKTALRENNEAVRAHLEIRGMLPSKDRRNCGGQGSTRRIQTERIERTTNMLSAPGGSTMRDVRQTSKTITRDDFLQLCSAISSMDESKIKQIRK